MFENISVVWDQETGEAKVQSPHCCLSLESDHHYSTCVFPDWGSQGQGLILVCDKFSVNPFRLLIGSRSSGLKSQVPSGLCLFLACSQEAPAIWLQMVHPPGWPRVSIPWGVRGQPPCAPLPRPWAGGHENEDLRPQEWNPEGGEQSLASDWENDRFY